MTDEIWRINNAAKNLDEQISTLIREKSKDSSFDYEKRNMIHYLSKLRTYSFQLSKLAIEYDKKYNDEEKKDVSKLSSEKPKHIAISAFSDNYKSQVGK
jgi:hypothetical protein